MKNMKENVGERCAAACRIAEEMGVDQAIRRGITTDPGWQDRDALYVFTGVAFGMLHHGMEEKMVKKSLLAICKAVQDELNSPHR